jgi:CheY-like chemotaxis protein
LPRVLVVDDDKLMLDALRALLARLGFDVETADSVESAERVCKAHGPFKVILTDPTGLGFALVIKERNPLQTIGFMSASAEKVEKERHRFDFTLLKPITLEDLRRLFERYV